MATANDIIKKALSFEGVKESPANSNNVKFNTDYYGKNVSGSAYPWCAAFVWDIFRLCNASKLFYDGKKTAYCPAIETWGKKNKLTVDKTKGKCGDLVLFDWGSDGIVDHIGFIVSKNADGTYNTIEGNTAIGNDSNGGEVMKRVRNVSSIRCIIRPEYETVSEEVSEEVVEEEEYDMPTIKKGSKGTAVKIWQCIVGFTDANIDGDFGANTLSKTKAWQKKHSLDADGIVGPKTWKAALNSLK